MSPNESGQIQDGSVLPDVNSSVKETAENKQKTNSKHSALVKVSNLENEMLSLTNKK